MKVLVVDDDAGLRKSLNLILEDAEYEVVLAADGEEGLRRAGEVSPDLVMVDVRMPGMDGMGFLESYRKTEGAAPVVVMTAYGGVDLAARAIREGAADFLPKPFGADEVLLTLRKIEERERLKTEVTRLRGEVRTERRFREVVARSPEMVQALEIITKVAPHPTSILISGPTGSGKELLARLAHRESDRAGGPFVPVNCGAIPEGLLESQFFGYVKGAFSGADTNREGLFEAAHGGTLFLDEVGELPESLQVKLLRALQEREVRRVGDTRARDIDVRVVAATSRALEREVEEGTFRGDFFYRIAVVTVSLPPLRERPEDLPHLIRHLLDLHRERLDVQSEDIDRDAMDALMAYPWPGNVRELENALERALVLAEGATLTVDDLPPVIRGGDGAGHTDLAPFSSGDGTAVPDGDLSVKRQGAALERELIQRALRRTGGHRGRAAELLELSDRALRYKIRDYGLEGESAD